MKFDIKSFAMGIVFTVVGTAAVFAAGGIKSAEFNQNKVMYNGTELDISSPMVSVVKEGEENISNYMPVRSVLSEMGFGVAWDGYDTVMVFTPEYLEESEDWLDYEVVREVIVAAANEREDLSYLPEKFQFVESSQAVHVVFDARYNWDIKTAVAGGKVYVERGGVNNFCDLFGLPRFMTQQERTAFESIHREYDANPQIFVSYEDVANRVNTREDNPITAVWVVYEGYDNKALEIRLPGERSQGEQFGEQIAALEIHIIYDRAYVRKADINPYLIQYGYDEF